MKRVFVVLAVALSTVCAVALAPAAAGTAIAPHRAPVTRDAADAAAGWLARQLVDGERFEVTFGDATYPDQGMTIDAVFAFAAARTADGNAEKAIRWLARPEITAGYLGSGTESYAGAHAKLMLAALVRHRATTSFGGVDLQAGLRRLLTPSGRFSDRSAYGDYSNAFSQSLALLALDRTRAGAPPAAVRFLAGTQCADGGFPLTFGASPCVSDVDSTAMVTQALRAVGATTDAREGAAWLATQQRANGGFAVGTGEPNANSTGLATEALARVNPGAAAKGTRFLRTLQVGCDGAPANRGAIAYDATGFEPGTAPRATAQAILGLSGTPLSALGGGGTTTAPVLACR